MKIYNYRSYKQYVRAQTRANKRKIDLVWVKEDTIKKIIKNYSEIPSNILCHGTRNANEQTLFKKYCADCFIVGTEISKTAKHFPMTLHWDFHEINNDWLGKFDIIYSNSFDHTYDPNKCISVWRDQLSKKGRMYLEWCGHRKVNVCTESDPLQINEEELRKIFNDNGLMIKGVIETENKYSSQVFILENK